MTQIEQIKAEIERRYNQNRDKLTKLPEYCDEAYHIQRICSEDLFFIEFINSLHTEQPSEELDIDEELTRYFELNNLYVDSNDLQTVHQCNGDPTNKRYYFEDIARHFAQWQKEQDINKARKWLAGNVIHYIWKGSGGGIGISGDFFIDFEKAMEDEQ